MSKKERIDALIVGANGLVGRSLAELLERAHLSWRGTYYKRPEPGLIQCNVLDHEAVRKWVLELHPKVIFCCVNLSGGVNFCEQNPKIARQLHFEATQQLAKVSKEIGACFVFISTDYVFDGQHDILTEPADVNPLNTYGKIKLQAETWIQSNLSNYLIVRTTNVFGWDPETVTPNYMMNLYRTLTAGNVFHAPSFLSGTPTYVGDLVSAMLELSQANARGIYHIVGDSFVDRYHWALDAAKILDLNRQLICEVSKQSTAGVSRPLATKLNCDKFKSSYQTELHDHCAGLQLMKVKMDKHAG